MEEHVYKVRELVGSSEKSIEDAIQNAITRASKTLREMKWFEVLQTRGHIENGSVRHYQVTLKVGFTLEKTRRRRGQYIPLVAFCLRHFSAEFIICTCEFDFREAQVGTLTHYM
jgi:hypothetical protein